MHVILKVISASLLIIGLGYTVLQRQQPRDIRSYTQDIESVSAVFPRTVSEIEARAQRAMDRARTAVEAIIAINDTDRTFENTARALDAAGSDFGIELVAISVLNYVHPDADIRAASQKAEQTLEEFSVDMFSNNVDLYNAFKAYADGNARSEQLRDDQKYYVQETMDAFVRGGLNLPEDQRKQVAALQKELSALSLQFSTNINTDDSSIHVTRDALAGLNDDFIAGLHQQSDGTYKLGVDYPTYFEVMDHCTVQSTRKALYKAFMNRAYPANKPLLETIIAKRDALAQLLGFESYAHLNLDDEMVKTPERAEGFVRDLISKARPKVNKEFDQLRSDLPDSVTLTRNNMFYPWDMAFAKAYYKEKHFKLDDRKVAEYFPMQQTLEGLFGIYQDFFNITIKEVPASGLWADDVKLTEVYDNDSGEKLGYLLLDLHPRPNKYSHACKIGIVPALTRDDNSHQPAIVVVLANFPKSNNSKPSLLKHSDVTTFFHEFGHAIHAILGATRLASFSGTHVKTDFVEMPSQMLEEWMYDKTMLQQVTKHYQTGQSLPDDMIDTLIALKKFDSGYWLSRQAFFAMLSLEYFKPGATKDTDAMYARLYDDIITNIERDPETHMQASFGHLTGYGARYYGYLWSKVFALDLFEYIKPFGLRNADIGRRYGNAILAKGGSVDPNILLKDFLGREPNMKAFLQDMGL